MEYEEYLEVFMEAAENHSTIPVADPHLEIKILGEDPPEEIKIPGEDPRVEINIPGDPRVEINEAEVSWKLFPVEKWHQWQIKIILQPIKNYKNKWKNLMPYRRWRGRHNQMEKFLHHWLPPLAISIQKLNQNLRHKEILQFLWPKDYQKLIYENWKSGKE